MSCSYSNRELIENTFWLLVTLHRIIKLLRTLRKCIWVSWNTFFPKNLKIMPPGSQFRLRLRRRIEKLWGTIFSFKKHTKDGQCFCAEYFFEVFWRLLLKPKSRKNISSKVGKISNYCPVEGLNSKVRPGLIHLFSINQNLELGLVWFVPVQSGATMWFLLFGT